MHPHHLSSVTESADELTSIDKAQPLVRRGVAADEGSVAQYLIRLTTKCALGWVIGGLNVLPDRHNNLIYKGHNPTYENIAHVPNPGLIID
jgi:hypothetical protein